MMQTDIDSAYLNFKHELLNNAQDFTDEDIHDLVKMYESVINSKRRSSYIKDCRDLITILEKRAHVSPEDYKELKCIVLRLPSRCRDIMLVRLNQSAGVQQNPAYINSRPNINGEEHSQNSSPTRSLHSNSHYTRSCSLPQPVVDIITQEIGRKWRDLGRKLDVREGELDKIASDHKERNKCAYETLQKFLMKCRNQRTMEDILLNALEGVRRKDLRDSVREILNDR